MVQDTCGDLMPPMLNAELKSCFPSILLVPLSPWHPFLSPASCPHCAGDQEGLANHQHQHHEGRLKGVLVCPVYGVPVLVQG